MKIEQILPKFDDCNRYELFVSASPQKTYEAFKKTDFTESFIVNALLKARGLKGSEGKNFIHERFKVFYDDKKEVVMGLVARPWKYKADVKSLTLAEFNAFSEPGWTKILWNFTFEEKPDGTLVSTETRMLCTDDASRKKFRLYWTFVSPLSGWTRKEILKLIRKKATQWTDEKDPKDEMDRRTDR